MPQHRNCPDFTEFRDVCFKTFADDASHDVRKLVRIALGARLTRLSHSGAIVGADDADTFVVIRRGSNENCNDRMGQRGLLPHQFRVPFSDSTNPGFVRFTAAQMDAAKQALALWSDVARSNSSAPVHPTPTTQRILFSGDTSDPSGYAWAYFPGLRSATSVDGDVFLNPPALPSPACRRAPTNS